MQQRSSFVSYVIMFHNGTYTKYDSLAGKLIESINWFSLVSGYNCFIPDTPFGAEVKAWIADMQD